MSSIGCSVPSSDGTLHAAICDNDSEVLQRNKECTSEVRSPISILPQKAVVLQMQDLDRLENKVANALLKAIPKCNSATIKIFELIVSAIDPYNPPENRTVYIDKELFYKFLGLDGKQKSVKLRSHIKKFCSQLWFDFSILTDKERDAVNEIITRDNPNLVLLHKEHIVSAANEVYWEPRKPFIAFEISERILFFLSYLGKDIHGENNGKQFTTYDLIGMSNFESKYSVILYRWLRMKYQESKKFGSKIEISIDNLRMITDTTDLYDRFNNFEYRVLQVPQKEINQYSTIQFEYRKIKKGRNIVAIQFFVSDNPQNKPVKAETLKPHKTKEEREADLQASAYKAIISDYTDMLSDRMFLKKGYKKDTKLLARLNDDLYPLYDLLVSDQGEELLKVHLDMIQRRIELAKTDVNDVIGYLITCAKQSKDKKYLDEYKYQRNRHSYS